MCVCAFIHIHVCGCILVFSPRLVESSLAHQTHIFHRPHAVVLRHSLSFSVFVCCSLEASTAALLAKLQGTEAALTRSKAAVDQLKQQLAEACTENER